MATVSVQMFVRGNDEALRRTRASLQREVSDQSAALVPTDRSDVSRFGVPLATRKIFVVNIGRSHGYRDRHTAIGSRSPTPASDDDADESNAFPRGSMAHPRMSTQTVQVDVDGRDSIADTEGCIVNAAEWSEAFAQALADRATAWPVDCIRRGGR